MTRNTLNALASVLYSSRASWFYLLSQWIGCDLYNTTDDSRILSCIALCFLFGSLFRVFFF